MYLNNKTLPRKKEWRGYQEKDNDWNKVAMNYNYSKFCDNLKVLVERQLLTHHLIDFYMQRIGKYEEEQEEKRSVKSFKSGNTRRRVEDASVYHNLKKYILALE